MFPICARITKYRKELNIVLLTKIFHNLVWRNKHANKSGYCRAENYKFHERNDVEIQRKENIFPMDKNMKDLMKV